MITATHVIIGGIVFPWAAKAPYVASGKSVLGALEYNEERDLIKCHVCGEWFGVLNGHLRRDCGMGTHEYRRTYGLNNSTALKGAKYAKIVKSWSRLKPRGPNPSAQMALANARATRKRDQGKQRPKEAAKIKQILGGLAHHLGRIPSGVEVKLYTNLTPYRVEQTLGRSIHEAYSSSSPNGARFITPAPFDFPYITRQKTSAETKNLQSLCQAQIRARLTALVTELGRVPYVAEMKKAGLHSTTVVLTLGMRMLDVWKSLGFEPRSRGTPGHFVYKPEGKEQGCALRS